MEWKCREHGIREHDVFINYRVATDQDLALNLFFNLSLKRKSNGMPVNVFLDSRCLVVGEDWKESFLNGLQSSKIIVLLISEAGIEGIKGADKKTDHVLIEYEYALAKFAKGEVKVVPILVGKSTDGKTYAKFPDSAFDTKEFPDAEHFKAPGSKNIKTTMKALFTLQGKQLSDSLPVVIEEIMTKLQDVDDLRRPSKPPRTESVRELKVSLHDEEILEVTRNIREFKIPLDGRYQITVAGASGGDYSSWLWPCKNGGRGAKIQALGHFKKGQTLYCLVGEKGSSGLSASAGGGGSYVILSGITPLIICGGGGGATSYENGEDALFNDNKGGPGRGKRDLFPGGEGGDLKNNQGGKYGLSNSTDHICGLGGGGLTDSAPGKGLYTGSQSFANGGEGSKGGISGGFGGGGGVGNYPGGGGGGGMCGGGGGGLNCGGGGGGSFVAQDLEVLQKGYEEKRGDGYIRISLVRGS